MTDEQPPTPAKNKPAAKAPAKKPAAAKPEGPRRVLRWKGDTSVFNSGIPNRHITTADGLSDELIQLAIDSRTHERA